MKLNLINIATLIKKLKMSSFSKLLGVYTTSQSFLTCDRVGLGGIGSDPNTTRLLFQSLSGGLIVCRFHFVAGVGIK
jgi:hypothetical protein